MESITNFKEKMIYNVNSYETKGKFKISFNMSNKVIGFDIDKKI